MRRVTAHLRPAAIAIIAAGTTACGHLFGSYNLAPDGLTAHEHNLRYELATGQAAKAFADFDDDAPEDDVLRALYRGVIAYHAGDYAESARVLDIAGGLADDRVTKSISRAALSVITNDLILPYEPGRTERLMIPYYGALARVALGDYDGAAVEARRLSQLLELYEADDEPPDAALAATLRYFAGAVFEAHGDHNDSRVAYRNAFALDSALHAIGPAAHSSGTTQGDVGTVVVVLEQGFVAHRVEQGISVMLVPEELDLIENGESDERSSAIAFIAARTLQAATHAPLLYDTPFHRNTLDVPAPDRSLIPRRRPKRVCREVSHTDSTGTSQRERECGEEKVEVDEVPYLLRVSWPVYHTDSHPVAARMVATDDTISFLGDADISHGVVNDFRAERVLVAARTIARATAKLALTKGAENKLEEKNEAAARIIGLLGNIGNVLLERADTRSWHLLPAGISIARLELPPGEHQLVIEVGARTVTVAPVTVEAGRVSIMAVRAW